MSAGLAAREPVSATPAIVPAPISIEALVRWALMPGRCGGLAWRESAELSFDRGVTAQLRSKPRGSWALCIAGAPGGRHGAGRRVQVEAIADSDAGRVLAAVRALPGGQAALLVLHGRHGTRPPGLETVETAAPCWQAPGRPAIAYADRKRRLQPFCPLQIERRQVPTARAICAWVLWRDGLVRLAAALDGRLERWRINGLLPPAGPPSEFP